jgi:DNA polymerase elongation subunit (family B)
MTFLIAGFNLPPLISRVPGSVKESKMATEEEKNPGAQYHETHTSEINLVGRLVFNTWRMMRGELALYSYTLENVAYKVGRITTGSLQKE